MDTHSAEPGVARTVDADATPETAALHANLMRISGQGTLFGHQDDLAYGGDWWAERGRSDVLEVAGDYPSFMGWDVGRIEKESANNIDGVGFANMKTWIRQAYEAGSVNTISWHSLDPVSGGGYGTPPTPQAISYVLPGGERHEEYLLWLDRFAAFDRDLTDRTR